MLADHGRVDRAGVDAELRRDVQAEPEAVEEGARAQDLSAAPHVTRHLGQRLGRVGDDDDDRVGRCRVIIAVLPATAAIAGVSWFIGAVLAAVFYWLIASGRFKDVIAKDGEAIAVPSVH